MNKILALLLCITMSCMLSAQDIRWGSSHTLKNNEYISNLIAEDANGIYVLRRGAQRWGSAAVIIEHYSPDMKLQYSRKIKEIDKNNVFFQDFFEYNDKLFITFTQYRAKERKHILFYQEVNKHTGALVGQGLSLATSTSKSKNLQGKFDYAPSPDSSKAVIFFSEAPNTRTQSWGADATSNKFTVKVLDDKFEKVWREKITLPYDENLYEHRQIEVDNDGNVYILAKIYDNRVRERVRGKANYKYKIIALREGEKRKEYDLYLEDKFITDITFKLDRRTNDIICSGFYSERNSQGFKGAFFLAIDKQTKEISRANTKAFSVDFMSNFMRERRAERGGEVYDFNMRDIILRTDGGAVLIAEQFFVTTNSQRDFNTGMWYYSYQYNYNDIIAVNINPDGTIAWSTFVPKWQRSTNPMYSSFSKAVVSDKIYFVFNERISRRGDVMLATVNADGTVDMKDLFRNKESGVIIRPMVCRQVSDGEMIIYGEWRRKYKFGRIRF